MLFNALVDRRQVFFSFGMMTVSDLDQSIDGATSESPGKVAQFCNIGSIQ